MIRICLGWDSLERRPASPEEKSYVEGLAASVARRSKRFYAGLIFGGIVLMGEVSLAIFVYSDVLGAAIGLTFLACFVQLPQVFDYRRRTRFMRSCLPLEEVEDFGKPEDVLRLDDGEAEGENELDGCADEPIITVQPSTGLLIRQRGTFVKDIVRLEIQTLTGPPKRADEISLFPEVIHWNSSPGCPRRVLSPQELSELVTLRRAIAPTPKHTDIGVMTYFLVGAIGVTWENGSPLLLAAIAAQLAVLGLCFSRWLPQIRLRRDFREGAVVQVLWEGRQVEVLQHSLLVWTINGEPAPIRRSNIRPSIL